MNPRGDLLPFDAMKQLLSQLADGNPLTIEQATQAFEQIMTGQASPVQTAALLSLIAARPQGAAVDEIVGAVRVMRDKMTPVVVPSGLEAIDTCGMGGTGSSFFNISTAAALVAGAAGRPHNVVVAKHGNRAVTSRSGSAQVLETLGVKLQVAGDTLTRCLDEAGICFCFAPVHHQAMKHAMPIRQELGFRTLFNLVGPLTNPAGVTRQVIGVPTLELTDTIAQAMNLLGAEHVMIVHSQLPSGSGVGELTTFGPSQVSELHHSMIKSYQVDPEAMGLSFSLPSSVTVDSVQASANLIRSVLAGQAGPARDIVALNAAAALKIAGLADELPQGLDMAMNAIQSGAAQAALDTLVKVTQGG